jgi:hypothetical protein
MLTLGQAAKETGLSKPALSIAIKKGRISAKKNDLGHFEIDPAELFRVYPINGNKAVNPEQHKTPILQGQIEVLRELIRQLESERDDLRTDRDHWRIQATAVLADLRDKAEVPRRGFWSRLFNKR